MSTTSGPPTTCRQAEVDRLLDGADSDELFSDVNAAKVVLGTASVPDDPDTDARMRAADATGTFIALEAAEAALAAAQADFEDVLEAYNDSLV